MDEETLKRFVACGQFAQKAVDDVIATMNKDAALEAAAKKAATTGNREDLAEYLKLRRDTL